MSEPPSQPPPPPPNQSTPAAPKEVEAVASPAAAGSGSAVKSVTPPEISDALTQPSPTAATQSPISDKKEEQPPPAAISAPSVSGLPPLLPPPPNNNNNINKPKAAPTLCINPNKANFTINGGVSKHLLINKSSDRLAIKIRSSNNGHYRVNPVYQFLECNAVSELEIIRFSGGTIKEDKLQVMYVVCTENDTDATKLFGFRAKLRSVILPLHTTFAKPN